MPDSKEELKRVRKRKDKKTLTLMDDNEYSIVDLFNDNNITYIYLVDINNNANIIYGKVDNDEVIELSDQSELEKVIKMVNDHLHNK